MSTFLTYSSPILLCIQSDVGAVSSFERVARRDFDNPHAGHVFEDGLWWWQYTNRKNGPSAPLPTAKRYENVICILPLASSQHNSCVESRLRRSGLSRQMGPWQQQSWTLCYQDIQQDNHLDKP